MWLLADFEDDMMSMPEDSVLYGEYGEIFGDRTKDVVFGGIKDWTLTPDRIGVLVCRPIWLLLLDMSADVLNWTTHNGYMGWMGEESRGSGGFREVSKLVHHTKKVSSDQKGEGLAVNFQTLRR